jgi:hypothetical protein
LLEEGAFGTETTPKTYDLPPGLDAFAFEAETIVSDWYEAVRIGWHVVRSQQLERDACLGNNGTKSDVELSATSSPDRESHTPC